MSWVVSTAGSVSAFEQLKEAARRDVANESIKLRIDLCVHLASPRKAKGPDDASFLAKNEIKIALLAHGKFNKVRTKRRFCRNDNRLTQYKPQHHAKKSPL